MIIVDKPRPDDDFELRITLVPHRSMTWQDNKKIIGFLGFSCLAIALFFTLFFDAWMILPFAGLEALAVGAGLYYASWKISYRDIITVATDCVQVDKGVYRPRKSWSLPRRSTRLKISDPKHHWESKNLELVSSQTSIRIGKLLDKSDIEETISLLSPLIACSS